MEFILRQIMIREVPIEAESVEEAQMLAVCQPMVLDEMRPSTILFGPHRDDFATEDEYDVFSIERDASAPDGFERTDQNNEDSEIPFWLI